MSKYKDSVIGKIPSEWNVKKLSNIAEVQLSNVNKKESSSEKSVLLCNYKDVFDNEYITSRLSFMENTASEKEIEKCGLREGDVIITKDSETREDIAKSALVAEDIQDLVCGYHLAILKPNNQKVDSHFLSLILKGWNVHHYLMTHANGITRFGIRLKTIENTPIPLPSLSEQNSISSIFKIWNIRLSVLEKLIKAKKSYKKGLMQQLLSGKKRFPEFEEEPWIKVKLKKFFKPYSNKNKQDEDFPIMSCSKVHGITRQENIFDKRVASKDLSRYKIIEKHDLVYDPMLLWDASIGFVEEVEKGVISPAYYTFKFKNGSAYRPYFKFLLETHYMKYNYKAISQGTNKRRRKAPKEAFLNIPVELPKSIEEQKKIAETLLAAQKEITLLKEKIDLIQQQKKGLMQKLLNGKVRVNKKLEIAKNI